MNCLCGHEHEKHQDKPSSRFTLCLVDDCGCPDYRPDYQKAYIDLAAEVRKLVTLYNRLDSGELIQYLSPEISELSALLETETEQK